MTQTLVGTPDPPEPERLPVHHRALKGRFLALCRADCKTLAEWTDHPEHVTCPRCLFLASRPRRGR